MPAVLSGICGYAGNQYYLMTIFPWDYQKRIDHLSVYMKSSGKEYQNHFATICLWAERDGGRGEMDKYEFQEGESL